MTLAENLVSDLRENLTSNILPFWTDRMADPRGGFLGRIDGDDTPDYDAPKGAILNGRLLWTFSAAYRVIRDPQYLAAATRAYEYLRDHFLDREMGGVYWSVDAAGAPLDTKKQSYAIGFAIYGLSEYCRATASEEALEIAKGLFRDLESRARDSKANGGGYIEAFTRDWQEISDMRLSDKDANEKKTMNTHLHILEPYTNLYRVWPDASLREAIVDLLRIFLDVMEDKATSHLGLFFDEKWVRHDSNISYGHDIEASWLLLEAAGVLLANPGEGCLAEVTALYEKTKRHCLAIANAALEGRSDEGWMAYERFGDGRLDLERHWWVQAEDVVGLVYLYKHHGVDLAIDKAWRSWCWIKDNLVDHNGGEWHWSRFPGGDINRRDDKAGFWKCPYHNSRMCLEVIETLFAE
jgi:mannobiose 2-epimerase